MTKNDVIIVMGESYTLIRFSELCEACHVSEDFIYNLMEYEIIHPHSKHQNEWMFELSQLRRVKTVLRLQRDFEINLSGIALVLDLLDEITDLRERLSLYER
jgi:chaperone modulatory protein CbpM